MMRWHRGPAPPLLDELGPQTAEAFTRRRALEPGHSFSWPQRANRSLGAIVRDELLALNHGHCCSCDSYPIGAAGRKEVDHFRPKTRFPEEVCTWENLSLGCTACNGAKSDQWSRLLLRSDASDFDFARYFSVTPATGEIAPNPRATVRDRARARATIRVLDLDNADRRIARRKTIANPDQAPFNDRAYRFLYAETESLTAKLP